VMPSTQKRPKYVRLLWLPPHCWLTRATPGFSCRSQRLKARKGVSSTSGGRERVGRMCPHAGMGLWGGALIVGTGLEIILRGNTASGLDDIQAVWWGDADTVRFEADVIRWSSYLADSNKPAQYGRTGGNMQTNVVALCGGRECVGEYLIIADDGLSGTSRSFNRTVRALERRSIPVGAIKLEGALGVSYHLSEVR